ncbi:MAG: serine protease Do [Candidatus Binatia bacterium]|jgi:serine protease Do
MNLRLYSSSSPLRTFRYGSIVAVFLALAAVALGQPVKTAAAAAKVGNGFPTERPMTYEEITEKALPSIVVVSQLGRDGIEEEGVGAGFVVRENGLIATSLHVIGEGRAVMIKLADGRQYHVTDVHAWDRKLDLAILRIDAKDLQPLPLGDSDALKQGTIVVALGNPHGFEHSVVKGEVTVVSSKRNVDDNEMIQLAIPVEPGNSGSPVMDLHGRVHGVLTMKSAVTRNLGFAMPVNDLKAMLEKPNPVPMDRWQRIGSLDSDEWISLFGAHWFRKAGQIRVEGIGDGFGGRALCLSQEETPERPYEIAVSVRLDDESGAAGLVFASDGRDRHYGFYATGGRLRLTRFDGPTVYTWTILETLDSTHYRPGKWNDIKVRHEEKKILCYVNDRLVMESTDDRLRSGWVGLAKFRDTQADFKRLRIGKDLPPSAPTSEAVDAVLKKVSDFGPDQDWNSKLIAALTPKADASRSILQGRAEQLDREAKRLRQLASAVHVKSIEKALLELLDADEDEIDLFHASLLLAKLDNPELELRPYRRALAKMTHEIRDRLKKDADDEDKLELLKNYLFEENGFHGSRTDYDNPANSYMSQVIDDREGLPITLSVLFMELSRELGVKTVVGVPLPSHFVVRHIPAEGSAPVEFIDVFNGGETMTLADAARMVRDKDGRQLLDEHLLPATKRQIVMRMLRNLEDARFDMEEPEKVLPYLELLVALDPENPYERMKRGMLRARVQNRDGAREDFGWLLEHQPRGIDLQQVEDFYRRL